MVKRQTLVIWSVLIAAALAVFLVFYSSMDPAILIQQMIGGIKPAALIAVPMFIFATPFLNAGSRYSRSTPEPP